MDLITLIFVIVIFACIVWGLKYALDAFKMPTPAFWIVGAVVVIILLLFLLRVTGLTPTLHTGPILH